jgi:predicted nucleotidyltransferase component of viral defense system
MATPVRLIRNEFELQDLVDRLGRDPGLVERDFALVTIAAGLVEAFGGALCFKGGFVLRHVYGHERFSQDLDATRINPPKSKLDSDEFANAIRRAGVRNLLALDPRRPATDSGRSLDFDDVRYRGPIGSGQVSVEVSYREDVIEQPDFVKIGQPYYEPFDVPVMSINEIVAEKLRTLVQRRRPTDLSDLAMVLAGHEVDEARVRTLTAHKFAIVKDTDNRGRIERNVDAMGSEYDQAVAAVAPDAPGYQDAADVVLGRLSRLLP